VVVWQTSQDLDCDESCISDLRPREYETFALKSRECNTPTVVQHEKVLSNLWTGKNAARFCPECKTSVQWSNLWIIMEHSLAWEILALSEHEMELVTPRVHRV